MRISVVVHVSCIYDVGSFCLIFLMNSFASLSPSRNLRAVTHSESEEIKFKVIECFYYLFFGRVCNKPVTLGRLSFKCICSIRSLRAISSNEMKHSDMYLFEMPRKS